MLPDTAGLMRERGPSVLGHEHAADLRVLETIGSASVINLSGAELIEGIIFAVNRTEITFPRRVPLPHRRRSSFVPVGGLRRHD
jgi:hypothetical protein